VATFSYKGVSEVGRSVAGTVEADSPRAARARLRERGIFASAVNASTATAAPGHGQRGPSRGRRVSPRELSRTLRQLATLLAAGIPLVDALGSLLGRGLRPMMAAAVEAIRNDLIEGESLERAVEKHPAVFPEIYHGMIRAGEASGALDRVLVRIADHAEANARLQGQLRAAMTYPTIMMLVGGGIVMFLLAYVVPQVTRVFVECSYCSRFRSPPWRCDTTPEPRTAGDASSASSSPFRGSVASSATSPWHASLTRSRR
jgi:general secretion pathway protein F